MTYLFYTNLALWGIATMFIPKLFEISERNKTIKPLLFYIFHGLFTILTIFGYAFSLWSSQ